MLWWPTEDFTQIPYNISDDTEGNDCFPWRKKKEYTQSLLTELAFKYPAYTW